MKWTDKLDQFLSVHDGLDWADQLAFDDSDLPGPQQPPGPSVHEEMDKVLGELLLATHVLGPYASVQVSVPSGASLTKWIVEPGEA